MLTYLYLYKKQRLIKNKSLYHLFLGAKKGTLPPIMTSNISENNLYGQPVLGDLTSSASTAPPVACCTLSWNVACIRKGLGTSPRVSSNRPVLASIWFRYCRSCDLSHGSGISQYELLLSSIRPARSTIQSRNYSLPRDSYLGPLSRTCKCRSRSFG